ncbi:DNA-binding protein [Nocardia nova]|uniref:helix-turn-helix domain-containing protein n=1 Tax=Nocardia nova TaxID=37330 RepID=UPI000CE9C641|nr:DNA-binding protein [Nocardia nova]
MSEQNTEQLTAVQRRYCPLVEAGKELGGVSKVKVYSLINAGELKRVKIGKRSYVTRKSIEEFLDRLEAKS